MKSENPQHKLRKERARPDQVTGYDILAFICVGMVILISCFTVGFLSGALYVL